MPTDDYHISSVRSSLRSHMPLQVSACHFFNFHSACCHRITETLSTQLTKCTESCNKQTNKQNYLARLLKYDNAYPRPLTSLLSFAKAKNATNKQTSNESSSKFWCNDNFTSVLPLALWILGCIPTHTAGTGKSPPPDDHGCRFQMCLTINVGFQWTWIVWTIKWQPTGTNRRQLLPI